MANPQKKRYDAIIFIPFFDREYEMIVDTINSIHYYADGECHIIAVDDCSDSRPDEKLQKQFPGITILKNAKKHGGRSGLFLTLAAAVKYALAHFQFKTFMKMDTDALMIGPGLLSEASRFFEENPRTGILGSYLIRSDGRKRSSGKWRLAFLYESSCLRKILGQPVLWKEPLKAAGRHGYRLGENVLGGAYFLSEKCLQAMEAGGYLDYEYENILRTSKIGEDIICCLFCKACGFTIEDFATPDHRMTIALDFLPMPKEKIFAKGKAVIHSVKKGFDGESQQQLREYFASMRT